MCTLHLSALSSTRCKNFKCLLRLLPPFTNFTNTQAYPSGLSGQTTGLTIGQSATALPNTTNRGPWATTRDRYQQQAMPLPQAPVLTGLSPGAPSAGPFSGVASTHGEALPAMMVPNPSTPLGFFFRDNPLLQLLRNSLPMSNSRERSHLCPISPSRLGMHHHTHSSRMAAEDSHGT